MDMDVKYFVVTGNCGNETLGETGVRAILTQIKSQQLASKFPGSGPIDFVVINCQEAHLADTYKELADAIGKYNNKLLTSYQLEKVADMTTRTKLNTIFGGYGMATFVIYDAKRITLTENAQPISARRNPDAYGSAYNKGGLISNFKMTRNDGKFIDVQAISGHLDSNNATKRNLDFSIIHQAISSDKQNITYLDLVDIIPNIQVAGYDANTRNTLDEQNVVHNPWEEDVIETKAMKSVPLGAGIFTNESTYLSDEPDVTTEPSPKLERKGLTTGGALDILAIRAGGQTVTDGYDFNSATKINPIYSETARDHAILISPVLSYQSPQDQFDKVKEQIAEMLLELAPKLAQQIRSMKNKTDNQTKLAAIYTMYLARYALVDRELIIHTAKLNYINEMVKENLPAIAIENDIKRLFEELTVGNCLEQGELIKTIQDEIIASLGCSLDDFKRFEDYDDDKLTKLPSLGQLSAGISRLFESEEEEYVEVVSRGLERQKGEKIKFEDELINEDNKTDKSKSSLLSKMKVFKQTLFNGKPDKNNTEENNTKKL